MKLKIMGDSYNVFPPENRALFHAKNFEGNMFSEPWTSVLAGRTAQIEGVQLESIIGSIQILLLLALKC